MHTCNLSASKMEAGGLAGAVDGNDDSSGDDGDNSNDGDGNDDNGDDDGRDSDDGGGDRGGGGGDSGDENGAGYDGNGDGNNETGGNEGDGDWMVVMMVVQQKFKMWHKGIRILTLSKVGKLQRPKSK